MDRKTLNAIIDTLIAGIATEQGLEKEEAQTMLGIALKKNKDAIVRAVVVPHLGLTSLKPAPTQPATEETTTV